MKCLYATSSTVMLGYVITSRKSVTFRNKLSKAWVFSLLLNKLSEWPRPRIFTTQLVFLASLLEQEAAVSHFMHGDVVFVDL